jgi:hypothetical protein
MQIVIDGEPQDPTGGEGRDILIGSSELFFISPLQPPLLNP